MEIFFAEHGVPVNTLHVNPSMSLDYYLMVTNVGVNTASRVTEVASLGRCPLRELTMTRSVLYHHFHRFDNTAKDGERKARHF